MPFCQLWMKNSYPSLQSIWVKFRSRNSEVFKIYTKHLSFLVYNQVYNLFFCTLCPCLTSFLRWNWDKPLRNSRSLDMTRVTWKSRFRLDCVTKTWHTAIISDLCEKKSISNLHVIGMPFSYDAVLPIAGLWFLSVSINPRNANHVFSLVVCFGSTLFPRPDRSVSLGKNLIRFAVILQHAI